MTIQDRLSEIEERAEKAKTYGKPYLCDVCTIRGTDIPKLVKALRVAESIIEKNKERWRKIELEHINNPFLYSGYSKYKADNIEALTEIERILNEK